MQLCVVDHDGSFDLCGAAAHPVLPEVAAATADLYRRRGFVPPWTGFVAVESNHAVGSCGFAQPPVDHEAEIAYFTFPGHEGRGVATRMAVALMTRAHTAARSLGICFIAHTLPVEGASTSILRNLGFELLGSIQHPEDGEIWKWRLDRRRAANLGAMD